MGACLQTLGIGALAARTGVNIETIRYYERIGLMPPPTRTESRRRSYEEAEVQRLTFIRRSRELGFSVADIRKLLELAHGNNPKCGTARALTSHHLRDVRGKIASLKRMERALKRMIEACQPDGQRSCPIIDALGDTNTSR